MDNTSDDYVIFCAKKIFCTARVNQKEKNKSGFEYQVIITGVFLSTSSYVIVDRAIELLENQKIIFKNILLAFLHLNNSMLYTVLFIP